MLILAMFGKQPGATPAAAPGGVEAISKTSWKTEEERQAVVQGVIRSGTAPVGALLNILQASYSDSDKKLHNEKLQSIEEILVTCDPMKVSVALMQLVPRLVEAESKKTAFRVLKACPNPALEKDLVALLKHKDAVLRQGAEELLIAGKRKGALALLRATLGQIDWPSRVNAIRVIAKVGESEGIPMLKQFLGSNTNEEVIAALDGLAEMTDPAAFSALAEIVDGGTEFAKMRLSRTLGKNPDSKVLQYLVKLAGDENPKVQMEALEALAERATPQVAKNVAKHMEHPDFKVRLKVLKVLGASGDVTYLETLVKSLSDGDILVRQEALGAIDAMARKGGADLSPYLSTLLQNPDVNIRRTAAELVKSFVTEGLAPKLIPFLKDDDWWVRDQVTEALGTVGGDFVVNTMIKTLESQDATLRKVAVDILARAKATNALQPLTQLLKDPDWMIRERVVRSFGQIGDKRAVALLVKLLGVPELKLASVRSLGELGAPESIEVLMQLYERETNRDHRLAIVDALFTVRAERPVQLAKTLMEDKDKALRVKARDYLESIKHSGTDAAQANKVTIIRSLSPLDRLLHRTEELGATDLFLAADRVPMIKKHGDVLDAGDQVLDDETLRRWFYEILTDAREEEFKTKLDLDAAYETPKGLRFRVNLYQYRLGVAGCFRLIPAAVPTFESLGLPALMKKFCTLHQGIVLLTGPAASGKTTTMAALVEYANRIRQDHILTVEDPIEYVHNNQAALVVQREVHSHTKTFANALRAALREDPDIIVVGELRDLETISNAITAAETGHLVFGTLHTTNASNTVNRIIDAYPANQQSQIRTMLSESLKAVVSQQLVRKKDGGVTAALEILLATRSLAKQIRDGALHQINSTILTGRGKGMQTMDQALMDLYQKGVITADEAYRKAFSKKEFEGYLLKEQREAEKGGS